MTTSNRREVKQEAQIEEYTKEVQKITEQVTLLIKDIQDSKINFTGVANNLNHLIKTVQEISNIIRNDDSHKGSLLTRMALLEKGLEEIKNYIEKDTSSDLKLLTRVTIIEQKILMIEDLINRSSVLPTFKSVTELNNTSEYKEDQDDDNGKWKFYITIATGIFTLIGTALAIILESGC